MNDRSLIARALRRTAFGAVGGTLEAEVSAGTAALRAKLLTPDDAGIPAADPLWATDYTVLPDEKNTVRKQRAAEAIDEWIDHMVTSSRSHTEWLAWFWHGHFVVAQPEVRNPQFMVNHLQLLRAAQTTTFAQLITDLTKDPAMLLYLDGNDNSKEAPNENYSRELLELFTLGIGHYTEDDVDSGSSALTGWKIDRNTLESRLYKDRHDGADQEYLGVTGVDNLDEVVQAIVAHGAAGPFIAGRLARQIIGPNAPADVVAAAAKAFIDSGYQMSVVVASLVDALLAGADGGPLVLAPVPWFVAARRATGAVVNGPDVLKQLGITGQLPWFCPTVGGWPFDMAWQTSATNVGRFNLAAQIATATPDDSPALAAASGSDLATLAWALGLGDDFSATTASALSTVTDPRGRLMLALTSPEFVSA